MADGNPVPLPRGWTVATSTGYDPAAVEQAGASRRSSSPFSDAHTGFTDQLEPTPEMRRVYEFGPILLRAVIEDAWLASRSYLGSEPGGARGRAGSGRDRRPRS